MYVDNENTIRGYGREISMDYKFVFCDDNKKSGLYGFSFGLLMCYAIYWELFHFIADRLLRPDPRRCEYIPSFDGNDSKLAMKIVPQG